jgi:hypothetical protein
LVIGFFQPSGAQKQNKFHLPSVLCIFILRVTHNRFLISLGLKEFDMASWTPRIIQGGKTDDVPNISSEADAFLRAFIEAGLREQQYSHISFMSEEAPRGEVVQNGEIPRVAFGIDQFGAPVIHFQ